MAVTWCWVGAVTSTSAKVRGKVSGASVRLAYTTNSDLSSPSYTTAAAPASNIATHEPTGLTPDTLYYYALEVDSVLDTGFSGKFKTHGTAGTAYSFTFAASSCAGNSTSSEDGDDGLAYITSRMSNRPVFDTIREHPDDPQFFVHLGDIHYEDITSGLQATYRTAYDDLMTYNGTLTTTARQGRLYRNVPIVHIWDDHEYSNNDSDGSYAGKAAPAAVFRTHEPHYPLAEASAIYHEFTVGRVQFIMTDSRYYRNFAGGTMLGTAQMTWLQGVLQNSTAEFLVFCTQMQWHSGSSTQSWPGYPTERATIAGWISTYGWTNRMIMLTGDGHELGLDTGASNTAGGFPVYQLSALDSGSGVSGNDFNIIHKGGRDQYGMIRVDDNGSQITVTTKGYHGSTELARHAVSVVTDTVAPDAPTNLAVTDETDDTISLSWTAPSDTDGTGVAGYSVFRDGEGVGLSMTTTFTDTQLAPSTTYTYTVAAYDGASNLSAESDSVDGTTTAEAEGALMPWPDTILGSKVEMNIGGTWTDITSDVYGHSRSQIQITRGSANEASDLEPGRCTFTLNNEGGKYSPRNPASIYYGLIGRNTPVRVWVPGPTAHLRLPEDGLSSGNRGRVATTASMNITTDIDVRIEMALDTMPSQDPDTFEATETELIGRWDTTGQSWLFMTDYTGRPKLYWTPDGAALLTATATSQPSYSPGQRFALRVTLDVNNGASGNTVTFYTSDRVNGTWTQLGQPVTQSGTTSLNNPTSDLSIGDVEQVVGVNGSGRWYAVQVLNGIGGTAVVDADFTTLSDGATGLTDDAGRTWLFEGDAEITHLYQRFYGEVQNWPVEWETGGFDVWSDIEAFGVLRRLGQGAKPIRSALRRKIETQSPLPVAYWPLEDGVNSESGGAGLDGIINLATTGFDFASTSDQLGSLPVAQLGGTVKMSGTTFNATTGDLQYEFIYKLNELPAAESQFMRFRMTGGPINRIDIHISTTAIRMRGYEDGTSAAVFNVTTTDSDGLGLFTGQWNRFRLHTINNYPTAADVTYHMSWETVIEGLQWTRYVDTTGTTPGSPVSISGAWTNDVFEGMGLGHIAVWDGLTGVVDPVTDPFEGYAAHSFDGADHGHSGEYTVLRLQRLADESDVRLVCGYNNEDSTQLGPQTPDSFLNNIQSAADADMGRMIELRHLPSLAYRPRFQLYNPPTTMSLDYTQTGQIELPFAPIDDDQTLRNDVTVQREGGTQARSELTTGPLSTQDPPDGVGIYDEQLTLNLFDENQPKQWADWRLHLGTWDEARFPTISMNLRTATEKTEEWLNFEVGDVFEVTDLPSWMPPDELLLRMEGYTETINAYGWDIVMNCSPARPFRVGVVGDEILGHLDTAGCELAEDLTTTETDVDVTTTDGPLWTTESANMPFTIRVGGEVMNVTAISGASNPQTMTVTRSINGVVKAHSTGADVKLDEPARVVLG